MNSFAYFHFLRPAWLLAIPLILVVWWLVRRRESDQVPAYSQFAPHLRDALTVNKGKDKFIRAVDGVALMVLLLTLAGAGPTWNQQQSPWFAETAPLVIAIEVSDSMRSNDLLPTRLDRARFKVLDLVAQRTGSRTSLIAYAGSAHIVVPPSRDLEVLKPFLESLDPAIMPEAGTNAAAVLPLAKSMLGDESSIGTLLFVNDGFEGADLAALREYVVQPDAPSLAALIVGTDEGGVALMPDGSPVSGPGGVRLDTSIDRSFINRVSSAANMATVRAGVGDADINQLMRAIESNLRLADDPDARWRDQAWWLLWPSLLLCLFWFRRGWTMRW